MIFEYIVEISINTYPENMKRKAATERQSGIGIYVHWILLRLILNVPDVNLSRRYTLCMDTLPNLIVTCKELHKGQLLQVSRALGGEPYTGLWAYYSWSVHASIKSTKGITIYNFKFTRRIGDTTLIIDHIMHHRLYMISVLCKLRKILTERHHDDQCYEDLIL